MLSFEVASTRPPFLRKQPQIGTHEMKLLEEWVQLYEESCRQECGGLSR